MKRSESLDVLRGLAILLMVLSSSIAFGILPGWMYHAQVPPPAHVFVPERAGITWVDLVFPFFLFSMGAALPLALHKKLSTMSFASVLLAIVKRYLLLILFAFFTFYARGWVMSPQPGNLEYVISIAAFGLLFLMFSEISWLSVMQRTWVKVSSCVLATVFLLMYPFPNGFSLSNADIIILVLANMALFGSVIWCLTRNRPLVRIGLLPFVMAVFLASKDTGSINAYIFNLSPESAIYRFYFLKYLFIVIPGTLAGDWLLQIKDKRAEDSRDRNFLLILLPWLLVVINLWGLYTRALVVNLILSVILGVALLLALRNSSSEVYRNYSKKMICSGVYLLWLGLFFEAYEGGIKKDYSTYSYYFVCTGLAFLVMNSLFFLEEFRPAKRLMKILSYTGRNPMIAYTAGNLLLIPLLKISELSNVLDLLNNSIPGGFLRGVIFTSLAGLITILCTKKKIFWRT